MYCSKKIYYVLVALVMVGITGCPPVTIKPITSSIKHVTCSSPQSGSIDQTVIPAFGAFAVTHSWNNGATSEDLSNVSCVYPAYYSDNVSMVQGSNQPLLFTQKYDVLYKVEWSKMDRIGYDPALDKTYKNVSGTPWGTAFSENILAENANGYIEFEANAASNNVNDWAMVGFNNTQAYNAYPALGTFTGFALETLTGTGPSSYMGTYYVFINGWPVALPGSSQFRNKDMFSVKYTQTGVIFYHNGTEIHRTQAVPLFTHPRKFVQVTISAQNIYVSKFASTFGCTDKSDAYAELSKSLDATCYIMSNTIKFKYKEKYNDPAVECKVYDWQRNIALAASPTTVNNNGTNYHILNTNGTLINGEVYVMEATNSKGEVYKMRFRYNNYKDKTLIAIRGPSFPKGDIKEGANFTFGNDYE